MENNKVVPQFTPPPIGGYIENSNSYKYKIIKELTSGTFGTIFLGYDAFEIPYAIKVFKPAGRSYDEVKFMWQEEAQKLRKLFHPHIAYMHDVFEYKFAFYIVMELLGASLANFVKGKPELSDEQIIEISRQMRSQLAILT